METTKNKTVSVTKYKELKHDLASQIRPSKEMNRKREQEFQETLAAMQRRIVELKGRIFFFFFFLSRKVLNEIAVIAFGFSSLFLSLFFGGF